MYKQYYEHLHEYITNILYSDHRSLFLRIPLPEGEEEDDEVIWRISRTYNA